MRNIHSCYCWTFATAVLAAFPAYAQTVQIPSSSPTTTNYQSQGFGSVTGNPLVQIPQQSPQLAQAPSTTLGAPQFDPYSTSNAASQPPSLSSPSSPSVGGASSTPFWVAPTTAQGNLIQPSYAQPTGPPTYYAPPGSPPTTYSAPGTVPNPTYVPGGYVQQPPVLYPNGIAPPTWNLPQPLPGQYLRLFQDVRVNYTWLGSGGGGAANKMGTNDIELATTMNFPNFFYSGHPLHVSPGFVLSLWDGPLGTPGLPSKVYGTYLNFGWQPMITPQFGADVDFRAGVYSDFDTFSNDSVRLTGTGLLVLAFTPTVALKGGVTYYDRVDIKLLPAGGILWRPNPQTRFDISFPKPKLAQYLTTFGNTDVWWYINGEYGGGGSWTVGSIGSRLDINDMRIGGGLEWTCQSGVRGFTEIAYVFDRELVADTSPSTQTKLEDTIMVRGGIKY